MQPLGNRAKILDSHIPIKQHIPTPSLSDAFLSVRSCLVVLSKTKSSVAYFSFGGDGDEHRTQAGESTPKPLPCTWEQ